MQSCPLTSRASKQTLIKHDRRPPSTLLTERRAHRHTSSCCEHACPAVVTCVESDSDYSDSAVCLALLRLTSFSFGWQLYKWTELQCCSSCSKRAFVSSKSKSEQSACCPEARCRAVDRARLKRLAFRKWTFLALRQSLEQWSLFQFHCFDDEQDSAASCLSWKSQADCPNHTKQTQKEYITTQSKTQSHEMIHLLQRKSWSACAHLLPDTWLELLVKILCQRPHSHLTHLLCSRRVFHDTCWFPVPHDTSFLNLREK